MPAATPPAAPPFCPNPACAAHHGPAGWRFVRAGFHARQQVPHRVQRYRCCLCRRHFSDQTFRTSYWLKRADLLAPVFCGLVAGSGFRQLARSFEVAPHTIASHSARLGRHCLLFHQQHRPRDPAREPLVLDSFQSFEHSQYSPTLFHTLVGKDSHFVHGFTDSELRRSGRMSTRQKRRRARLEARFGRPDPRSTEREVTALLGLVLPGPQALTLHTDEHADYPRALRRLPHLAVTHRTISSRAARTSRNPLFAINLLDLLIRHSGANHKRETIAFSKRRQSAAERLWQLVVWRNWLKWFSERRRSGTPAMRAGVATRRLRVGELLAVRLFVTRVSLPARWAAYYWRTVSTRRLARCAAHRLRYAS
jgi:transposase-like protein